MGNQAISFDENKVLLFVHVNFLLYLLVKD